MRFEALEITIHDIFEAPHIPIKVIVNSKGTYVQYESNANI